MHIQTIAVVGAGLMGRGIAQVSALAGYNTILEDISGQMLESALATIREDLDGGVARGKISREDADAAYARIRPEKRIEDAARQADLVIEAVPEDMETKIEVFTILDKSAPPHTIFASNTSSLSVSEMASITFRGPNFLGMHFFNPVPRMKLLEIVQALETNEDALAAAEEVGRRMGKETVRVKESPGFVTSRISALVGNEAFYMLQEGLAKAEDIDKAIKLGLNYPMGPLELADFVGLDTTLHVLQYLHRTLGEKFRPCPLLSQYVKAGRLGRKSGRGVYNYTQ